MSGDFGGAILRDVSWQNSAITGNINFGYSDLSYANFTNSMFRLPENALISSNLSHAVFVNADLSSQDLSNLNLQNANFSGADLSGADLTGANLSGVNLQVADLWGADLENANLSGANLTGTNLWYADLTGATLTHADLNGADLHRTTWFAANLERADLTGVDLTGAKLTEANLADDPMTLIDHEVPEVRAWAAQRITDPTVLMQLALDDEEVVRAAVLENGSATDEIRVAVTLRQ